MTRTVPTALQTHLDGAVTTTCRLLRIQLRDGRVFGVTSLDADVTYNDGRGSITYSANQGVDPSALSSDSDLSVSNAEAQSLLVTTGSGITEAMIEAGELRDAEWTLYLVNYRNLANGHAILGAGDVGEVTKRWGLVWMPELLSYSVRLRQPIGTHWSRTCRAIFGSAAEGQTGCGVAADTLWVSGTVSGVGAETDRVFTGSVVAGAFVPGRVEWVSGQNVGRIGIIDSFTAGTATLANAMPYPIVNGNTYRIRPDCARTWAACTAYGNQLNFKGEPLIPSGDAASVSTPGAQTPLAGVDTQGGASVSGPSVGTGGGSGGTFRASGSLGGGYVGLPFYYNGLAGEGVIVQSESFKPVDVVVSGASPPGIGVFVNTAPAIGGFPTAAGTYSFTVTGYQTEAAGIRNGGTALAQSVAILAAPARTVWNPLDREEANPAAFQNYGRPFMSVKAGGNSYASVRSVSGVTSGKHYAEMTVTKVTNSVSNLAVPLFAFGVDASAAELMTADKINQFSSRWYYAQLGGGNGTAAGGTGALQSSAIAFADGDVLMLALDASLGRVWFGKNGTWINGGNPAANTGPTLTGLSIPGSSFWDDYRLVWGGYDGAEGTLNCGDTAFAHTPPSGFAGWALGAVAGNSVFWNSQRATDFVQVSQRGKFASVAALYAGTTRGSILATAGKSTGSWQIEFQAFMNTGFPGGSRIGLCRNSFDPSVSTNIIGNSGSNSIGLQYINDAGTPRWQIVNNGTITSSPSGITFASTDIITIAANLTANTVQFYRNGVAIGGVQTLPTGGSGAWFPAMSGLSGSSSLLVSSALAHPQSGFTNWAP